MYEEDAPFSTDIVRTPTVVQSLTQNCKQGKSISYTKVVRELLSKWSKEVAEWKEMTLRVPRNALKQPEVLESSSMVVSRFFFTLDVFLPSYSELHTKDEYNGLKVQKVQTFNLHSMTSIGDFIKAIYCPYYIFDKLKHDEVFFYCLDTFFVIGTLATDRARVISAWIKKAKQKQDLGILDIPKEKTRYITNVNLIEVTYDTALSVIFEPLLTEINSLSIQEIPLLFCHNLCTCEHIFNISNVSMLVTSNSVGGFINTTVFQKRNKRHKCYQCNKNAVYKVCGDKYIPQEPNLYCEIHFQHRFYTKNNYLNEDEDVDSLQITKLII